MLKKYLDGQALACNIMMSEIKNGYVSHAYLIDENNCSYAFDVVISFVKEILCNALDDEEKKALCKKIDDGNYSELKIIEPDGIIIKKQQILDLQKDFSRCAIEGERRIYIIREVDKMRSETANSMLKFLEEPDNNILAILMTNNYNNLLPTITSRCQRIKLNNDNLVDNDDFSNVILNFIESIEKNGEKTIISEQELLSDIINTKDREKLVLFFDKMIDMYYDILKILSGRKKIKYDEYYAKLSEIAAKNTFDKILEKISCMIEMKDTIKNNVNINLLIDSLIVTVGGIYESSRN